MCIGREAATRWRRRWRARRRTGYSWTPLVPGAPSIIDGTGFDRLLRMGPRQVDGRGTYSVTVEGGMKLSRLIEITKKAGYTLKSPTLFPWPSIAGATSTGAHGVGRQWGGFSDSILSMEFVDAAGDFRRVERGDADFPAAMVALGTLGLIYSVELEVEREFSVYVDRRRIPVAEVLQNFPDLIESYEFIEMFWIPGEDEFYFLLMDRSGAPPDHLSLGERVADEFETRVQRRAANQWVPFVVQHFPALTPTLNKLAGAAITQVEKQVRTASRAFHFQDAYAKNWDISYSVPVAESAKAWADAIDLVNDYAASGKYPINFAMHARVVGPGDAYLAPNQGRESLLIEAATALATPNFQVFFDELEARWRGIAGARPHWGKLFRDTRGLEVAFPEMAAFLEVRERWDPNRVFLNDWLEHEVFGLT